VAEVLDPLRGACRRPWLPPPRQLEGKRLSLDGPTPKLESPVARFPQHVNAADGTWWRWATPYLDRTLNAGRRELALCPDWHPSSAKA